MNRNPRRRLGASVALALICSCSSSDDPGEDETRPARFESASPADGERRANRSGPFEATAGVELRADSIDETTVQLLWRGSIAPVAGTAELVGDETVRFTPASRLGGDRNFDLVIEGVRALDGRTLPPLTVSFRTDPNRLIFSLEHALGDPNAIERYRVYEYNDDAQRTRTIAHDGPGADGQWLTADDAIQSYTDYTTDGAIERSVTYNNPGANTEWLDADDEVSDLREREYVEAGLRSSRRFESGADGQLGTADDIVGAIAQYEYDELGELAVSHFGDAGVDGIAFNDDDVRDRSWFYVYEDDGDSYRYQVNEPGADGEWGTADDIITSLNRYENDGFGHLIALSQYADEGVDGTWITQDDTISEIWVYDYESPGALAWFTAHVDPGADQIWRTADDGFASVFRYDTDSQGRQTGRTRAIAPGDDGIWRTADDQSDYYEIFEAGRDQLP